MEEANERKREKYQDLVDECKEKGWKTWCSPIEVGSRGFACQSMWRMTKNLNGIVGNQRKRLLDKTTKAAERASRWLWLKKEEQWQNYSVPGQE